jgi:hypothetical protein
MSKRGRLILLFVLCGALWPNVAQANEEPPSSPLQLTLDAPLFWLGGQIESGDVPDASLCGVLAPCPTFDLVVPEGGHRLRVAYDTPARTNSFRLDLIAPGGEVTSVSGSNVFNAEAFVTDPAAGTWTVRMVPQGVSNAFFRMRAKLESTPQAAPSSPVPLLPNLKAVPPYELGFVAPANPANAAYPPDTVNPPLSVAGVEPLSCTVDEMAPMELGGGGAEDCLRLTTGPINTGDGPFIKTFTFASDAASGQLEAEGAYIYGHSQQVILHSDGSTETRPGGTYSFHTTHAHFHDEGVLTYELFRVDGDALTPAGNGTKSGFCPADQLIGEWRLFRQDSAGFFGEGDTASGNCYGAADNGMIALTRGWGDVYRWQRPGQYVEFSGNGDGLYVIRATVDKGNTTLETNEGDNSAYTLARISGRRIELLERGQGLSPFDPGKVVFAGYGPASQDPYGALPSGSSSDQAPPSGGGAAAVSGAAKSASRPKKRCKKGRKSKRHQCAKKRR